MGIIEARQEVCKAAEMWKPYASSSDDVYFFHMRMPGWFRILWAATPRSVKHELRELIIKYTAARVCGEGGEKRMEGERSTYVFNINVVEAKAEASSTATITIPERLADKLADLLEFLEFIAFRGSSQIYPQSVKERARRGLEALRELQRLLQQPN